MGSRGHSEGITMSGGGLYSLATIGAKHVIDAATPMVIEAIDSLPQENITSLRACAGYPDHYRLLGSAAQ